jgi:hypothetical protein
VTAAPTPAGTAALLAAKHSAKVTDWSGRLGWIVGLLLFVALVYWLMRQGWKWRALLQSGLPELPALPGERPEEPSLVGTGRYHGTTTAGNWLDRVVAHGLGVRSLAELALTRHGVEVRRTGAPDFLVPTAALGGARLDKGIAGKVLTEGGLLVITWRHGGKELDSGFRLHTSADHPAWVEAIDALAPGRAATGGVPAAPGGTPLHTHDQEGAR